MINSVFVLENGKIKGIDKEKEKVKKIVKDCGKVVENDIKNVDLLITMGGDGTLIKGFHLTCDRDVLIYGIKYGRVGFLTNSSEDIEEKLRNLLDGNFYISERTLLEVEIKNKDEIYRDICLNEVIFFRKGIRILDFSVEIQREKLFNFRGDGIIFSTPTGSTGHSLSAGGPILSPEISDFIVIPVMPHLLTTRPVILSEKAEVKMKISDDANVVVDGQKEYFAGKDSEIKVCVSKKKCKIILDDEKFFEKLSSKFNWSQ